MPTCPDCSLTISDIIASAIDNECPRCGATLQFLAEPSSPLIASKGDTLELVLLGEDTLKEIDLITFLYFAAEDVANSEGIPTVQQKANYEARMQNFIDWLVQHRRPQVSATMRKKV